MRTETDARLLAAVAAAIFFGASAYAAIGDALGAYSPGPLALLRMLVASAVLAVYATISRMRLPEARDLPAVALAGLFAFALYNLALNSGQVTASAGVASLIIASIPIFTALLAAAFLGERLDTLGWSGIAVGFVGVALITVGERGGFGINPGALLVLLAAVSASVYFAFQKPYLEKYGSLRFTAYAIWAGPSCYSPSFRNFCGRCGPRPREQPSPSSTWASSPPWSPTRPSPTSSRGFQHPGRLPSSTCSLRWQSSSPTCGWARSQPSCPWSAARSLSWAWRW